MPVWIIFLPPELNDSRSRLQSEIDAYRLAATAFGVAGLLDAAAEILSLRCLMLRALGARGVAEGAAATARSVLLGGALSLQQAVRTRMPTDAADNLLLNPMLAFGAAQFCASSLFLLLLWYQCHCILSTEPATEASTPAAGASTTLCPSQLFFTVWPPLRTLPCSSGCASGPLLGETTTEVPARQATHAEEASWWTARAAAATRASPGNFIVVAAFQWTFGRFLSAEHLRLLPTFILLLTQKLVLQHGEQLLLLLLLDASAGAEYALVSGAASVLCRVILSPSEAAAFEAFCALQMQPGENAAAVAAEGACGVSTAPPKNCGGASADIDPHASIPRNRYSPHILKQRQVHLSHATHQPAKMLMQKQESQQQLQEHPEEDTILGVSGRRNQNFENDTADGNIPSGRVARTLICQSPKGLLGSQQHFRQQVSAAFPALSLLHLLLQLHGTVGLAAAAGGCLFAAPALLCIFGPSTVAPGSGCTQALQV
ncbi:hypothetical protein cyc_05536 [Cyclospora cayetanensis]|nr:hypothetical protein cyc_05536 [Cyclospora cayetanensis]